MRRDKLSRQNIILYLCGTIPVIWIALLISPYLGGGLPELIPNLGKAFSSPFHIQLCGDSVKTVLVLLLAYALAIGIYITNDRNYRRREEHGSARWGTARAVNKKYADKNVPHNKILTQNVAIGMDGRQHRRNLNVLCCGGSGSGKTRFYAKPNLMNADCSYVVLDPKGEMLRDCGKLLEKTHVVKVIDLINMEKSHCYTQLFQQLYYQADQVHGGRLPIHVHFLMDEFANVALPDEFDKLLATMRSREISVSIIIQNMAQLKALFEKQWESIVGNCDEFLYLGGNEQSSHKYVSELLGKETIDTNTYGQSRGRQGNYSTNWQVSGRELMTPDEVRMLDNRYALLFIRGERPVKDYKYNILKHPNVKFTTDGGAPAYKHGEDTRSIASIVFSDDLLKQATELDVGDHNYVLFSDEDMDEMIKKLEENENE